MCGSFSKQEAVSPQSVVDPEDGQELLFCDLPPHNIRVFRELSRLEAHHIHPLSSMIAHCRKVRLLRLQFDQAVGASFEITERNA